MLDTVLPLAGIRALFRTVGASLNRSKWCPIAQQAKYRDKCQGVGACYSKISVAPIPSRRVMDWWDHHCERHGAGGESGLGLILLTVVSLPTVVPTNLTRVNYIGGSAWTCEVGIIYCKNLKCLFWCANLSSACKLWPKRHHVANLIDLGAN